MNRIQQLLESLGDSAAVERAAMRSGMPAADAPPIAADYSAQFDAVPDACHALFAPLHYERNYAYPLIVWLHGPCDDERQLQEIMPRVSLRNYVAASPRGTLAESLADGRTAYGWSQDHDHIALAEHRVLAAIEAAGDRFHIAPSRIFLAGVDCGGTMAFRIAVNHPHLVAGAMSFGGAFPKGHRPLGRLDELRGLRLFLATGRDSRQYPPAAVCDDLRLLHSAGMSVSLRQYPCGDDLTTNMLADMDRWIMEQLTPLAQVNSDSDQADQQARGS